MRYRGRQHHRHYQQSWLCWQMRSALQWKPDVQVLHFPWRGKSLEVLCIRREVVKNVETLNNLLEKERIQNSTCSLQAHLLPLLRLWDLYHRLWGLHHWEGPFQLLEYVYDWGNLTGKVDCDICRYENMLPDGSCGMDLLIVFVQIKRHNLSLYQHLFRGTFLWGSLDSVWKPLLHEPQQQRARL